MKVIGFIKARPTEVWLGGWTVVVGILQASGVELGPTLVSAIAAAIGWLWTFIASRPSNDLGPPPKPSQP